MVEVAASVEDLLSRHDAEFVACAFITLLRRPADPEGFLHYLARLRRDGDKHAIIHALCSSEEGRNQRPRLGGLRYTLARHCLARWSMIRRILALRAAVLRQKYASEGMAAIRSLEVDAVTEEPFDPAWYVKTYPPVACSGLDPHEHYRMVGKAQGLMPHASAATRLLIDRQAYLDAYPDVAQAGMEAWNHYFRIGRKEGRTEGVTLKLLQFDGDWYVKHNPELAQADVDGFQHFTSEGILYGRDSSSFKGLKSVVPEARAYTDPLDAPPVRVIAFWGRRFPDWDLVARATPYYAEHDQPRSAGDLGCYGPRSPGLLKRQADLARSNGLHGFCFYVHGSGSKRVPEQPLAQLREDRSIDVGFCLCWTEGSPDPAEGTDPEAATSPSCGQQEGAALFVEISKSFADSRYTRVEGKPLLIIDSAAHPAATLETVARWRDRFRALGVGEIHLCALRTLGRAWEATAGMDATIEFPPATAAIQNITSAVPDREPDFGGQIQSYVFAAKAASGYARRAGLEYRCVMPGWDTTATQLRLGSSFYGATSELYAEWLGHALKETLASLPATHRLVFVNAWNEWTEGGYLEPDGRHGHAYLNRTREAIAAVAPPVVNDADLRAKIGRRANVAVVVHLYYSDLLEAIAGHLDNIPQDFDLYFSVREGSFLHTRQLIQIRFPGATVVSYPNRGRDVLPFLRVLAHIRDFGYDAICKIHAKKSRQRDDGDRWRTDVLDKLLGSRARVVDTIGRLRDGIGLIAPAGHLLPGAKYVGSNKCRLAQLAERMACPAFWLNDFRFPAGTMFWCRPEALVPVLDLALGLDDFEPEAGQADGTTAHAIERLFGLGVRKSGLAISTTSDAIDDARHPYPFAAPVGKQVHLDTKKHEH